MKKPGQIVTFNFPNTDSTVGKPRPALLLAKTPGPFDDWWLCMVSTELRHAVAEFDELILPGDSDFAQSGLRSPSLIRLARVSVVSSRILIGAIGAVAPARLLRIRQRISDWIRSDNGSPVIAPAGP